MIYDNHEKTMAVRNIRGGKTSLAYSRILNALQDAPNRFVYLDMEGPVNRTWFEGGYREREVEIDRPFAAGDKVKRGDKARPGWSEKGHVLCILRGGMLQVQTNTGEIITGNPKRTKLLETYWFDGLKGAEPPAETVFGEVPPGAPMIVIDSIS